MNYQPTYHPGDYYPIFWMDSRPYGGTLGYAIAPLANSEDEQAREERRGWTLKGRAGRFHVWYAGKNLYYVTDGELGEVLGQRQHFGSAFSLAHHHERLSAYEA